MRALVVPPLLTLLLAGCALNEKEERALVGAASAPGPATCSAATRAR
jgi:hypothetical protein